MVGRQSGSYDGAVAKFRVRRRSGISALNKIHQVHPEIEQISREEKRNRETITRIVRSDEMREFVQRMREAFYCLADSALVTVRHALEEEMDGQLAYKVLQDIGAVPTEVERQQIQTPAESKDEEAEALKIALKLFAQGITKGRIYGYDTTEEENDLAKAGGRIDMDGNLVPLTKSGNG